jgi:molybdenum ABC transporter molybdate-binding protein
LSRGLNTVLLRALAAIGVLLAGAASASAADALQVLAAGSLREVLGDITKRYHTATGVAVTTAFGPSGVLRERIENGEKADLFASADMGHPVKLLVDGRALRVAMFTRNALCGIALSKTGLTTENFLGRLLYRKIKLGTSTPQSDPSGDYTWAMFRRAEMLRPGAYDILDKKADKLVGGPATPAPSDAKDAVATALASGQIDVMIGYCSGRKRLAALLPDVQFVEPPPEITTGPEYGLAVLKNAAPMAADFALYLLSPESQQLFAQYGFMPVGLPMGWRPPHP